MIVGETIPISLRIPGRGYERYGLPETLPILLTAINETLAFALSPNPGFRTTIAPRSLRRFSGLLQISFS
jgi:hypothetical protein